MFAKKIYMEQQTHQMVFLVFYPPTPVPKAAYFAPPDQLPPLEEPERRVDRRDTTTPAPLWHRPITAFLM